MLKKFDETFSIERNKRLSLKKVLKLSFKIFYMKTILKVNKKNFFSKLIIKSTAKSGRIFIQKFSENFVNISRNEYFRKKVATKFLHSIFYPLFRRTKRIKRNFFSFRASKNFWSMCVLSFQNKSSLADRKERGKKFYHFATFQLVLLFLNVRVAK